MPDSVHPWQSADNLLQKKLQPNNSPPLHSDHQHREGSCPVCVCVTSQEYHMSTYNDIYSLPVVN